MTPLLLYDTATRSMKPVVPHDGKTVRIYTCGPTVYNFAHIGNFRTFLFEDLLRRTLLLLGYNVCQVMNLTDVDDKTIKGAQETHMSLQAYTEMYIKAFFEDLRSLRIQKVEQYPKATAYISHMIAMIQTLLDKKAAYIGADGSVYFSIASFAEYGTLSHLPLENLQQGASGRQSGDEYEKDSIVDFVLWKAYEEARDGTFFWESPWGKGRPGWHIECSVMAKHLLGDTIDIHAGGVDLIFPHHENERAQSEKANGCSFSSLWVHGEHLMVDGKKMSKRFHNFYTLRDLLNMGYKKTAIRFLLLSTHYRTQLNFTLDGLNAATSSIKRLRDTFERIQEQEFPSRSNSVAWINEYKIQFEKSLSHDLAISEALAHVFDAVRETNSRIDARTFSKEEQESALRLFRLCDTIFDILTPEEEPLPPEIDKLLHEREQARLLKNWKESDRLRTQLFELGYTIEDTSKGPKIWQQKKKNFS